MRRARWLIIPVALLLAAPLLAQSATPSPAPTASDGQATLAAMPTYALGMGPLPTHTPFPTANWPTLTPGAVVVRPWVGIGPLAMTPGGAYEPPPFPDLDAPDLPGITTAYGFQAINDANTAGFMVYLMDVAMTFYKWFVANFPRIVAGARWFVIIMIILYGVFLLWKGSKFAPPDAERDANPTRFFFRSFRLGGRYAYYKRGSRKRGNNPDGPNGPQQGRLW